VYRGALGEQTAGRDWDGEARLRRSSGDGGFDEWRERERERERKREGERARVKGERRARPVFIGRERRQGEGERASAAINAIHGGFNGEEMGRARERETVDCFGRARERRDTGSGSAGDARRGRRGARVDLAARRPGAARTRAPGGGGREGEGEEARGWAPCAIERGEGIGGTVGLLGLMVQNG
jgi:hypothetical protein